MELDRILEKTLPAIVEGLADCRHCPVYVSKRRKGLTLAGQSAVIEVLDDLVSVMFPGCHGREPIAEDELKGYLHKTLVRIASVLREQMKSAFEYQCTIEECEDCDKCGEKADAAVAFLVESLPSIQALLQRDIVAAYEGDPAAKSTMEVVMSYPGVYAIAVHRIAHALYEQKVPLIARIMSEYAHSKTGIDIHPGAKIGPGFFMDHGTGIVIGETCEIGENVKLYQGVTLGALSFEKDAGGNPVKGIKRHPNIGDNVVVYAGATILGGETTIGANSEIGGNVWLTHSVPAGSRVYNQQPKPLIRQHK